METQIRVETISLVLLLLNFIIIIFQLVLKTEIKRLDEKVEIFTNRLEKLEKLYWELIRDRKSNSRS